MNHNASMCVLPRCCESCIYNSVSLSIYIYTCIYVSCVCAYICGENYVAHVACMHCICKFVYSCMHFAWLHGYAIAGNEILIKQET